MKLINEYKCDPPKPSGGDESAAAPSPTPEGGEKPVFVDYMYVCVSLGQALSRS